MQPQLHPGGPAGPGGRMRISLSPPLAVPDDVRLPSVSPPPTHGHAEGTPGGAASPQVQVRVVVGDTHTTVSAPAAPGPSPRALAGRRLEESADETHSVLRAAVHHAKQRAASLSAQVAADAASAGFDSIDHSAVANADEPEGALPHPEYPAGGVRTAWGEARRGASASPRDAGQLAQRLLAKLDDDREHVGGGGGVGGEGSPARTLRELMETDWRSAEEFVEDMAEQQGALVDLCENLCRSELGSHWKLLRLRKALALVPKLTHENRVLREELLRARAANPHDVQQQLHQIEVERRVALEQHSLRQSEEASMKHRLRSALQALKNAAYPDPELITYVSTALDYALGIVFRVEDERSRLQDDVSTLRNERDAVQDAAQAKEYELKMLLATAEEASREMAKEVASAEVKKNEVVEELEEEREAHAVAKGKLKEAIRNVDALKEEVHKGRREIKRLAKDVEAATAEIEGFETRVVKMNQRHEDELNLSHSRHRAQLDAAEVDIKRAQEDNQRTVDLWRDKLEQEFERVSAMEAKWKASEDAKMATQQQLHVAELALTDAQRALRNAQQKNEKLHGEVAALEGAVDQAKSHLEQSEARGRELESSLARAEAGRGEAQKLLSAAIESAEVERIFNEKNVAEKNRLAEELQRTEAERDEAKVETQTAQRAVDAAAERESKLRRELDAAEEAKQTAIQSLEDMGAKAARMKALFEQAVDDANTKARDAQMAVEEERGRGQASAARIAELEAANAAMAEEGEARVRRIAELEGADATLEEAREAQADALRREAAAAKEVEGMEARMREEIEAARANEEKARGDASQAVAAAQEQVRQYEECLWEEGQRNERAEERLHAAVDQLKVLEKQRLGEYQEYKLREDEMAREVAQLEEKLQMMTQKYHDAKITRHAQKNAKSVGWILAGRGSLLRDIYRLHTVLQGVPNHPHRQVISAKELSCHILGTHLFECERRHLGMPPETTIVAGLLAEQNGDDTSPKHPSPRQSMRLMNHSPAAIRQDAPTSADYIPPPRTPPVSPPPLPPATRPSDYLSPF